MSALRRDSVGYTVGFAAVVCLLCAIPIAAAAVWLRPAQAENQLVDRLGKVLGVAGLLTPAEELERAEIFKRFSTRIKARVVNLKTGAYVDSINADGYDQRVASRDPARSQAAPVNDAKVLRLPTFGLVYEVLAGEGSDSVTTLILPIQGYGLWSTMYGYLALDADTRTVKGITFYEHGETPGLGGEIENPRWQERWKERKAFDDTGAIRLRVIKGPAGPPAEDPYRMDGLSGSTITSRGVSFTLQFWLGDNGFGPYLKQFRQSHSKPVS